MKNIRKRALNVIAATLAVVSLGAASVGAGTYGIIPELGIQASAASGIKYINASGEAKTCSSYDEITDSTSKLNGGWFVVDGTVTIDGKLKVNDDSVIILTDGSTFTVKGGISVTSGVKLNIYTQRNGTAELYAGTSNGKNTTANDSSCGIGGSGAYVNIVGGNVYAKGGSDSYGIMGKEIHLYWTNSTDSIYASSYKGTVKVLRPFVDKTNGAAYNESTVSASAIKGVTLRAAQQITGSTTDLDDGNYAVFDRVTVSKRMTVSGTVSLYLAHNSRLKAEGGITVARGDTLNIYGNGGTLYAGTTSGSNITASDNNAGIGSYNSGKAGSIIINSGTVYANGGRYAAGIGGSGADIEIIGGEVNANGGQYAAGIGSSYGDNGASISITGGRVTANGGSNGAGIGSGYEASRSDITLGCSSTDDKIYANSYSGSISFLRTLYTSDGETAKAGNIGGRTLTSTITGYVVRFDSNGGTSVSSVTVAPGNYISSLPSPSRTGYIFAGWFTDRNLRYEFDRYTPIRENMTLYAKWVSNSYCTIYYNSMGGSYVDSRTVAYGKPLGASEKPYRSGYEFTGWYTDKNCYYLVNIEKPVYDSMTLYAGWKKAAKEYKLNFYLDGDLVDTQYVKEGDRAELNRYNQNYTWRTGSNRLFDFSTRIYMDYDLYSTRYSTCTISFATNGGSRVSNMTVNYGDTVSQTDLPFPTRNGYSFDGWYTDPDCIYKDSKYYIDDNITLYAGWIKEAAEYTVTFYVDGNLVDTQIVAEGGIVRASSYIKGFEWRTGSNIPFDLGTRIYQDYDLIAESAPQTYTYSFYYDGTFGSSMTVTAGEYVQAATFPNLYKGGYDYDGWFTDPYCTSRANSRYYVDGDLSFYAQQVPTYDDYDSDYYSNEPSDYGSTFGGAGLIAAIAGGVVLVGGGIAAGVVINKKKKK